jgi:hypothetical protein
LNGRETANNAIRVDGRGATVRIIIKRNEIFSKMFSPERGKRERHTHTLALYMEYPDLWPKEEEDMSTRFLLYCLRLGGADGCSQKAHVQSVVKGRAVLMTVDAPKREIQLQKEKNT